MDALIAFIDFCRTILSQRSQCISQKSSDAITYEQENASEVVIGGIKNSLSPTSPTTDSQVSDDPD
jgi:hypothetical protein